MPHALLLFGPRGVGKALTARTLSQALLCRSKEACGECLPCGKIDRETHPDHLRLSPLEGKRWITVGEIRGAIDWMHRKPLEGDRRVLIVDLADSLRTEAANALLKTLEEPPDYGLLILCSESPASLPETVVSRCRPVRFRPLQDGPLREILGRKGVEPSRIESAVRLARGSVGRAIAYLQEGGEETYRYLADLIRGLPRGTPPEAAASLLDRCEGDREGLRELLEQMGELYRDRLISGVGASELAALGGAEIPEAPTEELLRIFPILWRSRADVSAFVDPALVLQRALWEIREVSSSR